MTVTRREFCHSIGLLSLLGTVGCKEILDLLPKGVAQRPRLDGQAPGGEQWSLVEHVLRRCSYGPVPGDRLLVEEQEGIDPFIASQLAPDSIDDTLCERTIRSIERIHRPRRELYSEDPRMLLHDLVRARILRAVYSRRQLKEIMVDTWSDHFNIAWSKGNCRWLKIADEQEVIRPNALGKFRNLVRGSATSPAMLIYLDGHDNKVVNPGDRPNENYGRELLELHTLGVDGGYSQRDVFEAARCLSGWTYGHSFGHVSEVAFDPARHDDGAKDILGTRIPAGGGADDLERLLDIICSHPSTARHVSRRLVRTFVDDPAPEGVLGAAERSFRETDGDITSVVATILAHEDFRTARGTLFKRPFRFVVSSLRVTDADTDGGPTLQNVLRRMGQAPYEYPTPDGYPLEAAPWHASLLWRWNFAVDLCRGELEGTSVDIDSLSRRCGGEAASIRHILGRAPTDEEARQLSDPDALSLALCTPAFQWH